MWSTWRDDQTVAVIDLDVRNESVVRIRSTWKQTFGVPDWHPTAQEP